MTVKKKTVRIVLCIVLAVAAIGAGSFAYASDIVKKNSVGLDRAVELAMADAGVTEENTIIQKVKRTWDDGVFVYDVEFTADGFTYEYVLKASDGTVLEKDKEAGGEQTVTTAPQTTATVTTTAAASEKAVQPTQARTTEKQTQAATAAKQAEVTSAAKQTTQKSSTVSLEEAKKIALRHAGLSSGQATFTSAHKDYDDGVAEYDIEFYSDKYTYEYELDMQGNILSVDKDARKKAAKKKQTTKAASSAKYIGIDKAKSIALSHSGKKASSVTFTKAKLEKDDGIWEYEIEFETGGYEYEYEIHAESGRILSHSTEEID